LHYYCTTNCRLRYRSMTYNDFHIGDISFNRFLAAKLFFLGLFSAAVIKFTKKVWFRTGTFRSIARDLDSVNADCLKLLKAIHRGDINKNIATENYPKAEKALKKLIAVHAALEKDKFYGNSRIQKSAERALSNLFRLESQVKAIVTADNNCEEQDAALFDIASNISLGYFQA
jgi:uncharacterized hydantoinase/oxoprolinase family protein